MSIRFGRDRRMYVADYKGHNIFVLAPGAAPRVYFHSDKFNQPNDMALARDGTLYASDPQLAPPRRPGLAHRAGRRRPGAAT